MSSLVMEDPMTKNKPPRPRCLFCKRKFTPDPRAGSRQKCCSRKECQSQRQNHNERSWVTNPDNQKFLTAKRRRWRKKNPDHLKKWRQKHPKSVRRNRKFMREYQRRKRQGKMFEKTKEMTLQVFKNKGVVYASRGNTWVLMRLKRPLTSTKATTIGYASKRIRTGKVRRPQGRLYDLSLAFG
jgi:hypothetical protein